MAHEVETMFYNYGKTEEEHRRLVPWHGLGTPVEEAPTSADALKLAGLDWKVEGKPIFTDNGIRIPGYVANTRDNDGSVLGVVTEKYKIVQNEDAFAFTDSLIGGEVRYETAGSLRNGKSTFLLAKLPDTKILDDDFGQYLCFTNTHDGSGAVKVMMTPVRVVCNNTLNLALNTTKRMWTCKHMGSMKDKLHEAEETLGFAHKYMDNLAVVAERLANVSLRDEEIQAIVAEMFPMDENSSERTKANMQKAKQEFMVAYYMPDIEKFRNTAWGLLNATSDWMSHTSPQRNTPTYQERNFERIICGHPILDAIMKKVGAGVNT